MKMVNLSNSYDRQSFRKCQKDEFIGFNTELGVAPTMRRQLQSILFIRIVNLSLKIEHIYVHCYYCFLQTVYGS